MSTTNARCLAISLDRLCHALCQCFPSLAFRGAIVIRRLGEFASYPHGPDPGIRNVGRLVNGDAACIPPSVSARQDSKKGVLVSASSGALSGNFPMHDAPDIAGDCLPILTG